MTKNTKDALAKPITVFAEGTWDMMHYNHIEFLCECKSMGDRLVVGVVSDKSVALQARAGPDRARTAAHPPGAALCR